MVQSQHSDVMPEYTTTKPCCADATHGAECADNGQAIRRAQTSHPRTSDLYKTCNLPKRFDHPVWFYGYGIQRKPPVHPCYVTTSSDYGRFPPTVHTVPACFYPSGQTFTTALLKSGMYRNYSLNTVVDKNPV